MLAFSGTQHHGSIYDICCASHAAELAGFSRTQIVERLDVDVDRTEKASESHLPPTVSPHLTDDACGNRERKTTFECPRQERDDRSIVSLERDECTGVQGKTSH
jgi:hypothetical protein